MPVNDRTYRMAVNLARRGEMKAARSMLQEMIENREDDEQVWVWLAATYAVEETRARILSLAERRFPQGELVRKANERTQRRIEQKQVRIIEQQKSAPLLEFPVEPPRQVVVKARTIPAEPLEIRNDPPQRSPIERQTSNTIQGSDFAKLALAMLVVALTIVTAYLWIQLR